MITPIDRLGNISSLSGTSGVSLSTPVLGTPSAFENIFRSTIENVRQTEREKVQAQYLLATGQLDNPAALTIASSKYQVAVDLLVQLRNKSLEAYNELTRINL